jgi:hypothetical protein
LQEISPTPPLKKGKKGDFKKEVMEIINNLMISGFYFSYGQKGYFQRSLNKKIEILEVIMGY